MRKYTIFFIIVDKPRAAARDRAARAAYKRGEHKRDKYHQNDSGYHYQAVRHCLSDKPDNFCDRTRDRFSRDFATVILQSRGR